MIIIDIILLLTELTGIFWAVVVIGLAVGLGRLKQRKNDDKSTVAVLLAARNEEAVIANCLSSLSRQNYPAELLEIVLIDDNSTDNTREIAAGWLDKIPNFKIIDAGELKPGVAPKKNAIINGINNTTSDIIITTDADCEPQPGWISGMVNAFSLETSAVVGYSPLKGKGIIGGISRLDGFINGVVAAGLIGLGIAGSAVGRNFAYRRRAWLEAGGFGAGAAGASGDDDLLLQRIAQNGGKIACSIDPETFVPAQGKSSFGDWWRMKRRHYSAGKRYRLELMLTGGLLYLFNPALIAVSILAITGYIDLTLTAAIWGAKISVDGLALSRGARLFREQGWILPWLIAEIVSPLLLTILIPASMIGKVSWKGRKLDR